MRFMLLMMPRGCRNAAPDAPPNADAVKAMMQYNDELRRAGVLVTLNGFHPRSNGAFVSFAGGQPTVIDGRLAEAGGAAGGYWMIDVRSKQEAIEWASRCPATGNEVIEIRQVQEFLDIPADVRELPSGVTALRPRLRQRANA